MNSIEQFLQNNQYFSRFLEAQWEMKVILVFGLGLVLAFCMERIGSAVEGWKIKDIIKNKEFTNKK